MNCDRCGREAVASTRSALSSHQRGRSCRVIASQREARTAGYCPDHLSVGSIPGVPARTVLVGARRRRDVKEERWVALWAVDMVRTLQARLQPVERTLRETSPALVELLSKTHVMTQHCFGAGQDLAHACIRRVAAGDEDYGREAMTIAHLSQDAWPLLAFFERTLLDHATLLRKLEDRCGAAWAEPTQALRELVRLTASEDRVPLSPDELTEIARRLWAKCSHGVVLS